MKAIKLQLLKVRLLTILAWSFTKTGFELLKTIRIPLAIVAVSAMILISLFLREIKVNLLKKNLRSEVETWERIQEIQPKSDVINKHLDNLTESYQKIENNY